MVALLYPFTWQHTYIPVLPPAMIDIVCSPTPFLIGLLSSSLSRLKELPVEEVRPDYREGKRGRAGFQSQSGMGACQFLNSIVGLSACAFPTTRAATKASNWRGEKSFFEK